MNPNPETTSDMAVELTDLKSELSALRRVVMMMLAIVLFLTLALNGIFVWQNLVVARQLETARAEREFQRAAVPVMDEFLKRLERFAANNPDFKPILAKYLPPRAGAVPQGNSLSLPAK